MLNNTTSPLRAPQFDRIATYVSDCGRRRCTLLVEQGREPLATVFAGRETRWLARIDPIEDETVNRAIVAAVRAKEEQLLALAEGA